MTLVNINFNKQMYQPGEINARIQFSPNPGLSNLNTLLKSEVTLTCGSNTIAGKYYVHELVPEVSKTENNVTKLYVWFTIYSPDKLLTLERKSQAFTAKRLAEDILKAEAATVTLPYSESTLDTLLTIAPQNKLYYPVYEKKDDGTYDLDDNKEKKLSYTDGCIHPYLVQYDESFYDMLVRTANRWGEFVYFEGGQLIFGRSSAQSQSDIPTIDAGYTISYAPTGFSSSIRDIVSNDEYLEYIVKDDFLHHSGDLFSKWPDDKYGHKVVQSMLNMKSNVFDWLVDNGSNAFFTAGQNEVYLNKLKDEYNDTYFTKPKNETTEDTDKKRVNTQYAKVKLAKNADNEEEIAKATDDLNKAIEEAQKKENEVDKYAGEGYTYRDYVKYEEVVHPDDESNALKDALDSLLKAYNDYTTALDSSQLQTKRKAENKVDEKAEGGKTYVNYCKSAKVLTPTDASANLSSALKALQEKYDAVKKAEETVEKASKKKKEKEVYAPFSVLGELDKDEKNLSTVSSAVYAEVLKQEQKAGSEMVCVDLDVTYQHLCLGDIFKIGNDEYVVTRVECTVEMENDVEPVTVKIKINDEEKEFVTKVELKQKSSLNFRVYGLKAVEEASPYDSRNTSTKYYPAMLPSGHARLSNPQLAFVKETFDPKHNARYRIKYPWQDEDNKDYSPWIPVSHEMMSKSCGSVWQLEKGTVVMLNYKDGNVERPYIAGALQTEKNKASRGAFFNNMDLSTPAGHSIRMTDGYGAGAANFMSKFLPIASFIKAWDPDGSAWHNDSGSWEMYKAYEGGVEITDKYGIYSIKASTDDRNISIKSPYGDVNLNAFTGITISAPNGDVRIVGKNVSIEAGNKLTLESGKNISNAIFGKWYQAGGAIDPSKKEFKNTMASAAVKKAAGYLDLSLFRHVFEVFLRPVDGTLEIKSNRYLFLEAGKGKATIESDRYKKDLAPKLPPKTNPSNAEVENNGDLYSLIYMINTIDRLVNTVLDTIKSKKEALDTAKTAVGSKIIEAGNLVNVDNPPTSNDIEDEEFTHAQQNGQPKAYSAQDFNADGKNDKKNKKLVSAANSLAEKTNDFYTYIYKMIDNANANLFDVNTSLPAKDPKNPKTWYNDYIKNQAVNAVANSSIKMDDFKRNVRANFDFDKQKKNIKQAWFEAVFDELVNNVKDINQNKKFDHTKNQPNWQQYVNTVKIQSLNLNEPLDKSPVDPLVKNFTSFEEPVKDRQHWDSNQHGQVIMSFDRAQSFALEDNGTLKKYPNISCNLQETKAHIINLLKNWG